MLVYLFRSNTMRYSHPMDPHVASGLTPDGCPKYLRLAKSFERQLRAGVLAWAIAFRRFASFATRTR